MLTNASVIYNLFFAISFHLFFSFFRHFPHIFVVVVVVFSLCSFVFCRSRRPSTDIHFIVTELAENIIVCICGKCIGYSHLGAIFFGFNCRWHCCLGFTLSAHIFGWYSQICWLLFALSKNNKSRKTWERALKQFARFKPTLMVILELTSPQRRMSGRFFHLTFSILSAVNRNDIAKHRKLPYRSQC